MNQITIGKDHVHGNNCLDSQAPGPGRIPKTSVSKVTTHTDLWARSMRKCALVQLIERNSQPSEPNAAADLGNIAWLQFDARKLC